MGKNTRNGGINNRQAQRLAADPTIPSIKPSSSRERVEISLADGDPLEGFTPVYDNIVIGAIRAEKMRSGILMPDNMKKSSLNLIGRVVAVGPGRILFGTTELQPLRTKVGDHVMFSSSDGRDVYIRQKAYKMMPECRVQDGVFQGVMAWLTPDYVAAGEAGGELAPASPEAEGLETPSGLSGEAGGSA